MPTNRPTDQPKAGFFVFDNIYIIDNKRYNMNKRALDSVGCYAVWLVLVGFSFFRTCFIIFDFNQLL